jgi:hypothetical protein
LSVSFRFFFLPSFCGWTAESAITLANPRFPLLLLFPPSLSMRTVAHGKPCTKKQKKKGKEEKYIYNNQTPNRQFEQTYIETRQPRRKTTGMCAFFLFCI